MSFWDEISDRVSYCVGEGAEGLSHVNKKALIRGIEVGLSKPWNSLHDKNAVRAELNILRRLNPDLYKKYFPTYKKKVRAEHIRNN